MQSHDKLDKPCRKPSTNKTLTTLWRQLDLLFILCSLISLVSASCQSTRRTPSTNAEYKEIYLDQFKLTYFRQLLAKSYNNSNSVREIIGADHSGFTEPILTDEDYRIIDSLTTLDNQHLIIDSIEGHRRVEGAKGKRPSGM